MFFRVHSTYNVSEPSRSLSSYQIAIEETATPPHGWAGGGVVENNSDRREAVFASLDEAAAAIAEHVGNSVAILSDLIDGGYTVCAPPRIPSALRPGRHGFVRYAHVATGFVARFVAEREAWHARGKA